MVSTSGFQPEGVGSNPVCCTKNKIKMSIYATNYIVDDEGDPILVKHLNKARIDRSGGQRPGGWNKSGKKARIQKTSKSHELYPSKSTKKIYIEKRINVEED